MTTYLEFEKPIAELQARIADLRQSAVGGDVDISSEIEKLEAKADRCGQRPVDDRETAGGTAEEDRRSEAPVDGNLEAFDMLAGTGHAISAPPPKLKKDRKKLDAANAMLSPKMI